MATSAAPLKTSVSTDLVAEITAPPTTPDPEVNLVTFRESDKGKELLSWLKTAFEKAKDQQSTKKTQWYTNLAMTLGDHYLKLVGTSASGPKLEPVKSPAYRNPKTINRVRAFVRTEQSKLISAFPTIVSVPATGEDQDQRAAFAAQQVWESYSSSKQLRRIYARSIWWKVETGVGFTKVWWDKDRQNGDGSKGDVRYASISPFHLFVPNIRERELEDQPYVIEAQVRPLEWAKQFFAEELKGEKLQPSAINQSGLLDDAYLNVSSVPASRLDQVLVREYWIKPGATPLLPKGGLIITVEDYIVHYQEGLPYAHGQFPYTKFEHLSNETFYADSPITDVIPLQREYNDLRTDIALAAKRMGRPQVAMQEGAFDPNKWTNEPGAILQYRMGFQPPVSLAPPPIPQYVLDQQDRILRDIEDLTGQHEVSKGAAPSGVSAGTAMALLKESDDQFLTPVYHDQEEGVERIAIQTLSLFQQYVDQKRRIKVIGADGAYDSQMLDGADIADGLDVRVEVGSSIGQSMAAKRAQVMELVDRQLIDPQTALKMMEIGGVQKVLDLFSVAEKQAQRENNKMKLAKPQEIKTKQTEFTNGVVEKYAAQQAEMAGQLDPVTGMPVEPRSLTEEDYAMVAAAAPPFIEVNDFDMHEVHIEVHNRFRMGQEYETLPAEIKQQFQKHVEAHQQFLQQLMFQQQEQAAMAGAGADGAQPGLPSGGAEEAPMSDTPPMA